MNGDFEAVLDDCLSWLRAGADVKTCLARYPQYASELRPLLELSTDVQAVDTPTPSAETRNAWRRRMLEAFQKQALRPVTDSPLSRQAEHVFRLLTGKEPNNARVAWNLIAICAAVVLVILGGMVVVVWSSVPGDTLYPVKQIVREAGAVSTFDTNARRVDEQQRGLQIIETRAWPTATPQPTWDMFPAPWTANTPWPTPTATPTLLPKPTDAATSWPPATSTPLRRPTSTPMPTQMPTIQPSETSAPKEPPTDKPQWPPATSTPLPGPTNVPSPRPSVSSTPRPGPIIPTLQPSATGMPTPEPTRVVAAWPPPTSMPAFGLGR